MSTFAGVISANGFPVSDTVAYAIESTGGTSRIARTSTGVTEIGGGSYKASPVLDTNWFPILITWDNGTRFATETIEDHVSTSTHVSVSTRADAKIIFQRQIRVAGTLTDADSTPTISIVRLDTSATVLATTSTGVTHDGTGLYSYTLEDGEAGITYRATWTFIINGQTSSSSSDERFPGGEWYYAGLQDVIDLIGEENLRLISNDPGAATDATTDESRVTRTGELVDALMDGELSRLGYTTPLANMSEGSALILANVNAGMVVRELNRSRAMFQPAQKNLSEMDRRIVRAIADAEATWRKIKLGAIKITADRAASTPTSGAVYLPTWSDATWCGESCIIR